MSFIRFRPRPVSVPAPRSFEAPVVIVGAGPAGVRTAQELIQRAPDCAVMLFGDERWQPYNRVRLTPLMVGDIGLADVYFPRLNGADGRAIEPLQRRIVAIDRAARTVTDIRGETHRYSRLVLATGSRPHVPSIPGIAQANVFTFRDLDDVEKLMARVTSSRRTVVIGGGLLGLEAARGLHRRRVETVVIEHERHLMPRQLDDKAGALLAQHVCALGIEVETGDGIREILGDGRVTGVRLGSGQTIACDTVVVCTGIRPNIRLAQDAGLAVGRGIRVDDHMRTSDPLIYAVGECAEHRDKIYGLVAPGLEQAAVAAHTVLGGVSQYAGSTAATRLKVVGVPVFNIGAVDEAEQRPEFTSAEHENTAEGTYRRLILDHGRLVGAIAIGEWTDLNRVQEAVVARRRIYPWQLRRFRRHGALWPAASSASVRHWPATAIVCNCTGVTRGVLSDAMAAGCMTHADLQQRTGASTVCGSCRPLLFDLLGAPATAATTKGWKTLAVLSALSLLIALVIAFASPVPYRDTVQAKIQIDLLWTDGTFKQISGFTLLALSLVALLLSLRKRLKCFSFGAFGSWRIVHAGLGLATLAALFVHTGMNLGRSLNFSVMATFLAIVFAGTLSGATAALEHKLANGKGLALRRWTTWIHIVAFWPLLILLGFHILTVYYF
jgi:nitrite reductase (NADH) large subunit